MLFCLIRSWFRLVGSLIIEQKLFEALFVPSDWRAAYPAPCMPYELLKTGVKAEFECWELSLGIGMRLDLACVREPRLDRDS